MGAEVVEDTTQNTMKIRFMYVVKGKTIASSFIEVVDIKLFFVMPMVVAMKSYPGAKGLNIKDCALEGTKLFGSTKWKPT